MRPFRCLHRVLSVTLRPTIRYAEMDAIKKTCDSKKSSLTVVPKDLHKTVLNQRDQRSWCLLEQERDVPPRLPNVPTTALKRYWRRA